MTRVALVTGAARGQGLAITQRLRADGFFVAACDIEAVGGLDGDGVIGIPLDVTSESDWQLAVAQTVDRFGSLTTLINNAGALHRASIADETAAAFERCLADQLFGCIPRYAGGAGTAARRRRRGDRQHLQHRRDPAVPEPRRLRVGEMGAARPDSGRRSRAGSRGHSRQRGVPRAHRDTDAGRGHPGPARRHRRRSAGSGSRPRWPTRLRFWCRARRRSSPAPSSSSTAANASQIQ